MGEGATGAAISYKELGWCPIYYPRATKAPRRPGWQTWRPTVEDFRQAGDDVNIGLVLGAGPCPLVDVDLDCDAAIRLAARFLPPTDRIHGRAGAPRSHWWYQVSSDPPATKRYQAPGGDTLVELRGVGGQTMAPPSVHPSNERLEWDVEGDPAESTADALTAAVGDLAAACLMQQTWPRGEGSRHDWALALAGFLLSSGVKQDRATRLIDAACAGDEERADRLRAVRTTAARIEHGDLVRGAGALRELGMAPQAIARLKDWLSLDTSTPRSAEADADRTVVLIAGEHRILRESLSGGLPRSVLRVVEECEFAAEVLEALPIGLLYRRAGMVGELLHSDTGRLRFELLGRERAALAISLACALKSSKVKEDKDPETGKVTRRREVLRKEQSSPARAAMVLGAALSSSHVRDLRAVVPTPCYITGWDWGGPGWQPDGTYVDSGDDVQPIAFDGGGEQVIDELLCGDFPWRDEGDRQRYIGLMLTMICRGAIEGPVPVHHIEAPLPRTGKTLLASVVLGGVFGGQDAPCTAWSQDEEERRKVITSSVMAGDPVLLWDNLPRGRVSSHGLAELVTSTVWRDRILGRSGMVEIPHRTIVVTTGNNTTWSDEMAARVIPVRLQPNTAAPESRTGFKHLDIRRYVQGARVAVLGALRGLVDAWLSAGRPGCPGTLGGFEGWYQPVGGILRHAGYADWESGRAEWTSVVDTESSDPDILLGGLEQLYGPAEWTATQALQVVEETSAYAWVLERSRTRQGQSRSLGRSVLCGELRDRPTPGGRILRARVHHKSLNYRIERI